MVEKLVAIDFSEQDTAAALTYLSGLVAEGRVAGMIFAVRLKHQRLRPNLYGVTGRLADNLTEAAGLATMLDCQISHAGLEAK